MNYGYLYMFPGLAIHYSPYGSLIDAKLSSKLGLLCSLSIGIPDSQNLRFRKFGASRMFSSCYPFGMTLGEMVIPSRPAFGMLATAASIAARQAFGMATCWTGVASRLPALFNAISHIICLSAKKQMRRIHTSLIIACRAIVAHKHPFGYRPVCDDPRHVMRVKVSLPIPKAPIRINFCGRLEYPTSVRSFTLDDFGPKPFEHRFTWPSLRATATAKLGAPPSYPSDKCFATKRTNLFYLGEHDPLLNGDARGLGGSCRGNQHVRPRASYKINSSWCFAFPRQPHYSTLALGVQA